jgi:hypothetical protein
MRAAPFLVSSLALAVPGIGLAFTDDAALADEPPQDVCAADVVRLCPDVKPGSGLLPASHVHGLDAG